MLCKLLGHNYATRSFACLDGSVMFVNKCKRCKHTVTRHIPEEVVWIIQNSIRVDENNKLVTYNPIHKAWQIIGR